MSDNIKVFVQVLGTLSDVPTSATLAKLEQIILCFVFLGRVGVPWWSMRRFSSYARQSSGARAINASKGSLRILVFLGGRVPESIFTCYILPDCICLVALLVHKR